jgi:hypothetical protein
MEISHMRSFFVSACLASITCTGIAFAESPVAYVYVTQTDQLPGESFATQPIYAYSVTSNGKVTPVEGSPFTEISGMMVGTNGSHFITNGYGGDLNGGQLPLNYLYSYEINSKGGIGKQVSAIDTQSYSGSDCSSALGEDFPDGAELDHTGKYIYVPYCNNAVQTYKLASSGDLTFQSDTTYKDPTIYNLSHPIYYNQDLMNLGFPHLTGNSAFAYAQTLIEEGPTHFPATGFADFERKSDGSLEYLGAATVTGPSLPENYYPYYTGLSTNDSSDHLAVMLGMLKFTAPSTTANEGCALASFTANSKGHLTSTNAYDKMPLLPFCGQGMVLSPNGKFLVLLPNGGASLQFYHFNGSEPITPFTQVVAKSGYFGIMAWDSSNHLYALNGVSGRLHVFNVTSSHVEEAPGSPYNLPPHCAYDQQDQTQGCPQDLIVRSIP